ncbi:homocitrate synthase, partial [Paraburkholderia tropica]
ESFDPAELGRQRSVVLGKHSGSQSVRQAYGAHGVNVAARIQPPLLARIRQYATQYKHAPRASDHYRFLPEASETYGEVS